VSGIRAGAQRLLNYATYWQMKNRAGVIGQGGVNDLVRGIRDAHPNIKLHLVGHSFGARLVTAATLGPAGTQPIRPASLTLLQPAFSHYGFAQRYDGANDGFFRAVVGSGLVGGPIVVTYSSHDEAIGTLYPLASLVAGQVASALGDKDDPHGGMGRNGAQKTPEAADGVLLAVGGEYAFVAGPVFNLRSDDVIKNHGDIANDEVAYALLRAVAVT
jgi:pimeloyl-ACP methyl ester carboxylesterase